MDRRLMEYNVVIKEETSTNGQQNMATVKADLAPVSVDEVTIKVKDEVEIEVGPTEFLPLFYIRECPIEVVGSKGCREHGGGGQGSGSSQVSEVACQRSSKALRTYGRKGMNSKQSGDLCQVKEEPLRKRPELSPSPELELCELPSSSHPPHLRRVHRLEAVQPTETSLQQQVLQADIEIVDTEVVQEWELRNAALTGSLMEAGTEREVLVAPSTSSACVGSPMEEGTEREVSVAPSISSACVDVGRENFDVTLNDLSDVDMVVENATCRHPTATARNASSEPAAECDLTAFQARILKTEDRRNDHALRAITLSDCLDFNWKDDGQTFTGLRDTFTGTTGPTFAVTDQTSVVDVFYRMIDSDFVDRLCTETNRYASQRIGLLKQRNKLRPCSRLRKWSPTDRDEMISFLALTILLALYPQPEEESYFSYNGFGTMPYFSRIMSYNRYILLKTMLHFVDNETQTSRAKLCKVQPVMDYFSDKFSSLYYPSQEIVVDETLLKWQGRLSFAQKISSKTAKVGIKIYELYDSSNGYLWKFFAYARKQKPSTKEDTKFDDNDETDVDDNDETYVDDSDDTDVDDNDETNVNDSDTPLEIGDRTATATIVYNLVKPLLHRGHTLIMDNLYNSPLLARYLKRHNTDCYGTLRLNREFVPESLKSLTKTDLQRGEVVASYCSDLFLMVWRDANLVSMISTYHQLETETTPKYNRQTPSIVLDYNKSMGGVDRRDQMLSAQPLERNGNRMCYKKLFGRIFNVAMYNAYVIYATSNPKVSHRKFRTLLAEDLLKIHRRIDLTTELLSRMTPTGKMIHRQLAMRKSASGVFASRRPKLKHRHLPIRTGTKWSCCWLCRQNKKKSRTVWKCEECNVNLCIESCFRIYHV